ncbi:hypothetical protein BKA69DRAFT_888415 [Paraphysoderma sedebokerense]|nr:hypothetical protein BKA69DRAFT_888415 [Paraphysoderma sedebokerense]
MLTTLSSGHFEASGCAPFMVSANKRKNRDEDEDIDCPNEKRHQGGWLHDKKQVTFLDMDSQLNPSSSFPTPVPSLPQSPHPEHLSFPKSSQIPPVVEMQLDDGDANMESELTVPTITYTNSSPRLDDPPTMRYEPDHGRYMPIPSYCRRPMSYPPMSSSSLNSAPASCVNLVGFADCYDPKYNL